MTTVTTKQYRIGDHEHEEPLRLSPRDWNWLLELMKNPPEPNTKLKAALQRYQKSKQDDAGTAFNWAP